MKEPRIYYMGKRVRENSGRFSSLKKKVKNFIRKTIALSLVGLAFYGTFKAGQYITPEEIIYHKVEAEDTLAGKIEELKNEVLDTLQACESNGYTEEMGLIKYDPHPTNKKVQEASLGLYQFKVSTIQYHYKNLYGKELSGKEAVLVALDEAQSRELAKRIIFETNKGANEWWNCAKKHDLKNKVEIINKLTN